MSCSQCPRQCGLHKNTNTGQNLSETVYYCGKPENPLLIPFAKGMRHFWEEPCISGVMGSGTVFFSGCGLGCAFCQNEEISRKQNPKMTAITAEQLESELFKLKDLGCHNISFVTGSHLTSELLPVMRHAAQNGLDLPYVWNSSAYETVSQIRSLDRCISIYLPDLKFFSPELSDKVTHAPDYFAIAGKAVIEMMRQRPHNNYKIYKTQKPGNSGYENKTELLKEGVLIRHLVLPGFHKDSIKILEWIEANLSNQAALSLMSQYIPDFYVKNFQNSGYERIPSLERKVTTFEYDKVVNKAISLGFSDVYIQKKESAAIQFVPEF